MNTPFRDAGVPASRETRTTYGVYAGGRRIYYLTASVHVSRVKASDADASNAP